LQARGPTVRRRQDVKGWRTACGIVDPEPPGGIIAAFSEQIIRKQKGVPARLIQ